jgi:hypothetical protein
MKLQRVALLSAIGFLAAACSSDTGPTTTNLGALAYVRYVNAVPDTNQTDFKFVDQIQGSPYFGQLYFRDIASYEPVGPGARHIRIFAVDPNTATNLEGNISIVTQVFLDTTITFEANTYYTVVQAGYARAGATPKQHLVVIQEDRSAALTGSQIAVRAVNTSPTLTAADVYAAATASGTPVFSAVAFGAGSAYKVMSTGSLTFTATASGSTTSAASAAAPAGAPPASISQSALGGYTIGGSFLTAYIFPAAVAGSLGANASNVNCNTGTKCVAAGVVWAQDNFPELPGTGT